MIPDYLQPVLPVPDEWQNVSVPPMDPKNQQAAADIAWQDFFRSSDLQYVIDTALEHNRDLRAAALNVQAAQALYRIERSDIVPNVDVGGAMSRQNITEAQSGSNALAAGRGGDIITTTYTANIASTAFELDLFGRLRSQNESALEEYFASEAGRDALRISLIAETANAYLQWLADRKILDLVNETLATQQQSYDLINTSVENGVASKLDLAQVRQAVETARANKALYTRYVMQDRNALQLLMGDMRVVPALERYSLNDVQLLDSLPVQLPSQVLLLRPDVRQAEHNLLAANADIGAARAAFFPTISLTGSYGYASSELGDLFSSAGAGAWSFVPQITMPIFAGGRNLANLDYAEVIKDVRVAEYEKAVQNAFREVSDEFAARSTLDDELNAQRALVEASQQSYDLSYARYKEGIDSFLSVLDAQRALFTAQQRLIEVEQQNFTSLVNLYKSLGGGLVDKPEPAKEAAEPETEKKSG
jgi:multidrug efflux system outer membrane protein